MPPQAWALIIQGAAPLGIELIRQVAEMIRRDGAGQAITEAEWDKLIAAHASKAPQTVLAEAIRKAGLGGPIASPTA